jgi:hypothetical protein
MSAIDTSAAVLETLARQGAPARAVQAVRDFQQAIARIQAERYAPDREQEEISFARNTATLELRESQTEAELLVDRERDDELARLDVERATASRERRSLRDVVDVHRLETTTDPAEIRAIVADAARHGPEIAGAAVRLAFGRVKRLATDEQRRHILNGKCFGLMCELSRQQRHGGVDDASVRERYAQRKGATRTIVQQVANVAGLADALKTAAVRATMPETTAAPAKSRMIIGEFWERHPEMLKR